MRFGWVAIFCAGIAEYHGMAGATELNLKSDFGAIHLDVSPSGEVLGTYPELNGRIIAHTQGDRIEGIWLQPTSAHPCREEREGTHHWGAVLFYSPEQDRHVDGRWGYCEERPTCAWNARLVAPKTRQDLQRSSSLLRQ